METLLDILARIRSDERPDLLRVRPSGHDRFRCVSAREFLAAVDRCATGLELLGVGPGDRVGFVCGNRPEWHVLDFACYRRGAALVPLFPTLSAEQVAYCFGDAGCELVVVEHDGYLDRVRAAFAEGLRCVRRIVRIERGRPTERHHGGRQAPDAPAASLPPVSEWRQLLDNDGAGRFPGPGGADALASIIYTSGTTGLPKGVMLTHGNFVANLQGLIALQPVQPDDLALSLLPLCHVYERTADYSYMASGVPIAYSSPDGLSRDFQLVRPTVMIGVPRLYQKLRRAIEERVESSRAIDRRVYRLACRVGLRRARARHGVQPDGLVNRALYAVLDALVLRKIREAAGGRIRIFSAGGAALPVELNWWYEAMGWRLLEGYGLTEAAPVISSNSLEHQRIGTVGRPLFNVQVKIAEDGEVLARGPNVMKGYWQRAEETARTIIDGWLHTGDIGEVDADGYLRITDRKKSILVTSTGKNVAPQPVENALASSPWIEQALVVGDGRRFIAALLVPDFARLERWAGGQGIHTDRAALCRDPRVIELIQQELDRVQEDFAEYERARAFRLVPEPFTVDNGQMTPTLKLVRHRIEHDYSDLIEEIYAD